MRIAPIAWVFAVLFFTVVAAGDTPRATQPPSGAQPSSPALKTPRTQAGDNPVNGKLVTWGYQKMHNPESVVAALRDVQAGKLTPPHIATLGSAETKDRLVARQWPQRLPVRRDAVRGLPAEGIGREAVVQPH